MIGSVSLDFDQETNAQKVIVARHLPNVGVSISRLSPPFYPSLQFFAWLTPTFRLLPGRGNNDIIDLESVCGTVPQYVETSEHSF